MTQTLTKISAEQEYCPDVGSEFGKPPDTELMRAPGIQPVIEEISDRLEATHAKTAPELETGEAAARVIQSLGCSACELELDSACAVSAMLQERVIVGQANRELREKVDMLASSPSWLTAARLNLTNTMPETLVRLAGSPEEVKSAMANGELDLDKLLAGATNHTEAIYNSRSELPEELRRLKNLKLDEPLEAQEITTSEGDTFSVIDASSALPARGEPPSREDYGILNGKLLSRMSARDEKGNPHILSADQKMQKPIKKVGSAWIYEIRMNGKNREYILVQPGTDEDKRTRITILGAHGGDARTQRDFIDNTLATE